MRELTQHQKDFFLNNFFKNNEYAGWKNIATALLETGTCIVPGEYCIWIGGIGNFIKTERERGAFDCLLYTFDLEYFMTSEWYKQIHKDYTDLLYEKIKALVEEHSELCNPLFNLKK